VTKLANNTDQVASRKILCFFIVDPKHPIVSSLEVPPQQWFRTKRKMMFELLMVTRIRFKMVVPFELLEKIADYCKSGMSESEAEEHRLKLMKERKYKIDAMNEVWERTYSLCEH